MTELNTQEIEEGIAKALEVPMPKVRPFIPDVATQDKTQRAMRAVNRAESTGLFAIEAFVDEAIHARVSMMRGSFLPGPRDAYVRKMVLDAIWSISADNGHSLD